MVATGLAVAMALQTMLLETSPTLASRFEQVRAPIRCIASGRTPINFEAARRHIHDFQVTYIPGAGHFLMLEDPETFNRVLEGVIVELTSLARQ
jgi:pimeloyl-ACP methyl ester carboxylesterase